MVTIEGQPWFVAAEAMTILGMKPNGGVTKYLAYIDPSEYRVVLRSIIGQADDSWPNKGKICLSESGLYKLIMRSNKPQAKGFQDWVTKVVLPAIRKDGMYVKGEEKAIRCTRKGTHWHQPAPPHSEAAKAPPVVLCASCTHQ